MARHKKEADLEIRLSGKAQTRGGLDHEDLHALGDLLKGLAVYDPSLKDIHIFGSICIGSTIVRAAAPVELGLAIVNPVRVALHNFFVEEYDPSVGWTWSKPARTALERLTGRERTMGVRVMPALHGDKPFTKKYTRKDYELFNTKIAEEPEWRAIRGEMLEIDINDRTFEIHTVNGHITCKFPEGTPDESLIPLVKKVISADVLCRNKPVKGLWNAIQCKNIALAPTQDSIFQDFVYPDGIKPPKKPMVGGFNLNEFAPSLDAQAGEELGAFLLEFKG